MGSKKHKKHKSEKREKYEEYNSERMSLKLILKVGSNSTPEYINDSPAFAENAICSDNNGDRHKKSKKKKKKKDKEKRHKHKDKRSRHRIDDSSQDLSYGEENSPQLQESILNYVGITTNHSLAGKPITKTVLHSELLPEDISVNNKCAVDKFLFPLSNSENIIETSGGSMPDDICVFVASSSMSVACKNSTELSRNINLSCDTGREPRSCVLKLKQSKSPLMKLLDHLLRTLEKRDPHQFFAWPVTDDIAPGYSTIITKPMDFSTMRQKIEDNDYSTLHEFQEDFRLMCENAIRYNHIETVYHKSAKRLLHLGSKLLTPDNLIRSMKPLPSYVRELTPKELGFELQNADSGDQDNQILDSADETNTFGVEENIFATIEDDEKRKSRYNKEPTTHFEPFVDDMSPEDIVSQVQEASSVARSQLNSKKSNFQMGFLRQNGDGTTSLNFILDTDSEGPEKVVSLGAFTGKLMQGTGQLQAFREDRRNIAKLVQPLPYGVFSSYAPTYDSRFSNLTKEETELVLNTYGDETSAEYTDSIIEFTKDSTYANSLANSLLDILTQGEHRRTISVLYEIRRQKFEEKEIEKIFTKNPTNEKQIEAIEIDFDSLRGLSTIGVDMSFLNEYEEGMKKQQLCRKIQSQLTNNIALIEQLHQTQYARLSQSLPTHLSHVTHATSEEIMLASQITTNLTDIAKQLTPSAISEPNSLRKAMGISKEEFLHISSQHTCNTSNTVQSPVDEVMEVDNASEIDSTYSTPNAEKQFNEFFDKGILAE